MQPDQYDRRSGPDFLVLGDKVPLGVAEGESGLLRARQS
jgi:hypothetical protein